MEKQGGRVEQTARLDVEASVEQGLGGAARGCTVDGFTGRPSSCSASPAAVRSREGAPWTAHRLRHAGIAHAVSDGWNLAQVGAKSRHSSLRSLEVYANPSADSIRAMTDDLDGTAPRRPGTS